MSENEVRLDPGSDADMRTLALGIMKVALRYAYPEETFKLAPDKFLDMARKVVCDVVYAVPEPVVATEHKHHGHEKGDWFWACCACSGLYDPGCAGCNPNLAEEQEQEDVEL